MIDLKAGDRIFITDQRHPWVGFAGELIAFERYGLGWTGWRVELDSNAGETYVAPEQVVTGSKCVDNMSTTIKSRRTR